jgi:mannose-6-phosphate isomerase
VHPSAERAVEVRRATGSQVYVDDWAKPELLVAVSAFEVFVGMRSIEQVAGTFRGLGVRALVELLDRALQAPDPLHALLAGILHTPETARVALVRNVVAACVMAEGRDDPDGELSAAVVRIAEEHPDDLGVVVLLLMNHRVLHPGEFIDVPAGVLHSYVRGLGVEVLANSDNVVRAGLTGKTVNVKELLEIVDTSADGVIGRPLHLEPGIETFETTSDRFRLHRVRADEERILPGAVQGPRIAFCLRGEVSVTAGGERVVLKGTESAFLPADTGVVTARGTGELYVVSAPI